VLRRRRRHAAVDGEPNARASRGGASVFRSAGTGEHSIHVDSDAIDSLDRKPRLAAVALEATKSCQLAPKVYPLTWA